AHRDEAAGFTFDFEGYPGTDETIVLGQDLEVVRRQRAIELRYSHRTKEKDSPKCHEGKNKEIRVVRNTARVDNELICDARFFTRTTHYTVVIPQDMVPSGLEFRTGDRVHVLLDEHRDDERSTKTRWFQHYTVHHISGAKRGDETLISRF
nr:hypothetical protein [Deltaproteobacteria bacterium]